MADDNLLDLPRTRKEAKAAGQKRYFTGVLCPELHLTHRITINGACAECSRQRRREFRAKNVDKAREDSLRWNAANRERLLEKGRLWKSKNAEAIKEAARVWRRANLERRSAAERNRNAKKRDAEGSHTVSDIRRIRAAQKDRCGYCRCKLGGKGHVDNIEPLSRGGSNASRNLQILCAACNMSKTTKDPIEFSQSLGRLI